MTNERAAPSPLSAAETAAIEARVKALESQAGAQIVAAVVERSDVYHGLRWRAFAVAASLAGFGLVLLDELRATWTSEHASLRALSLVLGAGAAAALAATMIPAFARLFLEPLRAEAEIHRQAESLFLGRELFATRRRNAILILASRFERRASVYADRGVRERLPDEAWSAVTARMNPLLAAGRTADALLAGLDAAEPLLAGHPARPVDDADSGAGAPAGAAVDAANELPDGPIAAAGSR